MLAGGCAHVAVSAGCVGRGKASRKIFSRPMLCFTHQRQRVHVNSFAGAEWYTTTVQLIHMGCRAIRHLFLPPMMIPHLPFPGVATSFLCGPAATPTTRSPLLTFYAPSPPTELVTRSVGRGSRNLCEVEGRRAGASSLSGS